MNKTKILVVEDDKSIRKLITTTLEANGYQAVEATDANQGINFVAQEKAEIVILDLGLPDMDGTEFIKKIREWTNIPIIVVSARLLDSDKVIALDAGADDYLTKPFSVEELLARIRVAARRISMIDKKIDSNILENGKLTLDLAEKIARMDGEELHLTPIEYKILVVLLKNIGKVLTHNYIIKEVWGQYGQDVGALRVYMASLRKKLESSSDEKYIQTHIGIGYRMIRI